MQKIVQKIVLIQVLSRSDAVSSITKILQLKSTTAREDPNSLNILKISTTLCLLNVFIRIDSGRELSTFLIQKPQK